MSSVRTRQGPPRSSLGTRRRIFVESNPAGTTHAARVCGLKRREFCPVLLQLPFLTWLRGKTRADNPRPVYDERRPRRDPTFRDKSTVRARHLPVRPEISQQRKVKPLLFGPCPQRVLRIDRDTNKLHRGILKHRNIVAQPTQFALANT